MAAVPVGVVLIGASGADDAEIVSRARNELETDGQALIGEAAGNADRRQSAEIADGAQRIGIVQTGLEVEIERSGRNRLGSCCKDVKGAEKQINLLLQTLANFKRSQIVGRGNLLIHIPGDLAQRVRKFTNAALSIGRVPRSLTSCPAMAAKMRAQSSAERAIGPILSIEGASDMAP